MVDQKLLTIFVALTSVAILIQTGILVGFYILSHKVSRQANRAVEETQNLFVLMNRLIKRLQTASDRLAENQCSNPGPRKTTSYQSRKSAGVLERNGAAWRDEDREFGMRIGEIRIPNSLLTVSRRPSLKR